jgi:ornithine cyclodeaminase
MITQKDVPRLLPMSECVALVAEALKSMAAGKTVQPLRTIFRVPDDGGWFGTMPAYLGAPRALGVKVITVTPNNHGTLYDSHQGAVLLFEKTNGCLLAIIDATSITSIRTAAASGVATDALAMPGAATVALLGVGVQAAAHLEAMRVVRPIERVRVWSPHFDRAVAFAARETARHGIEIEATRTAREAVEDAAIVCTVTAATEPVLEGKWIAPGTHINAVGACVPAFRELDTAAVARSRLFVDSRESALHEAGDVLIPIREGAIGEDHIVGELGELLSGRHEGRRNHTEVTLFKSLGLAIEDLAAAHRIYANAELKNVGPTVDLGGHRDAPG